MLLLNDQAIKEHEEKCDHEHDSNGSLIDGQVTSNLNSTPAGLEFMKQEHGHGHGHSYGHSHGL